MLGSLMKDAFIRPQHIGRAKELSKKKTFFYLLFLSLVMLIPMSVQMIGLLQNLRTDGIEIAQTIPDFTIEQNRLMATEPMKSYIHYTDTFAFFFDPNGDVSEKDVDTSIETTTSLIGIALLQEKLYFYTPVYSFSTSYTQLSSLTAEQIRELFQAVGNLSGLSAVVFGLFFWSFVLLNLLIELLIYTLFANIYSTLMGMRHKFSDTWKIVMVASTLPTVFFALLEFVGITPIFQLEAKGLVIMVLFMLALKPMMPSGPKKGNE